MSKTINYKLYFYRELTLDQLYDVLQLRQEVFVVEQDCPYLDADGKDQLSFHLLGYDDDRNLIAYTRLVPRGISYEDYASIGRVITAQSARGTGEGIQLMKKSMAAARQLWPELPIKISAQAHLATFYRKFGFVPTGEEYLEDDIPHVGMVVK